MLRLTMSWRYSNGTHWLYFMQQSCSLGLVSTGYPHTPQGVIEFGPGISNLHAIRTSGFTPLRGGGNGVPASSHHSGNLKIINPALFECQNKMIAVLRLQSQMKYWVILPKMHTVPHHPIIYDDWKKSRGGMWKLIYVQCPFHLISTRGGQSRPFRGGWKYAISLRGDRCKLMVTREEKVKITNFF